ncbi:MAG: efflux RND transporter periplasmic adaptor subunit [Verrucomicrobia bacterium]|nr:efflux RND transporter periplasmic adaptor subunit [Verrucomicrobiota bacterium]
MARNSKTGWIKWLILLALLGGGGYYGWRQWEKKDAEKARVQFTTAKIEKGDVTQQVTASGTLNPVLNVQVGSQVSGLIKKINVDFNSKVKAGDLIAELDPATYQTRLEQNEADLASAKASLQLAEVNARRAEELLKVKLISQSEFDTAFANLEQAKAQVQTRVAQVNSTKVDLARCTIYAPIDGIVIDRKVDVGQTVAASLNAPVLFQIANDLTKMQIDANVAEADIGGVETNQNVKFTVDAFTGRDFAGKVVMVRNSPLVVANVVTYDTVIEVNNADSKLKPGMTANVQIITSERKGVVRIPNSALRFKPPTGSELKKVSGPAGTNAPAAAPAEVIPQTPEEMVKKAKELRDKGEPMSDEMRAKFREMVDAKQIDPATIFGGAGKGGGGKGGRGGAGGAGKRAGEPQKTTRTIYVVDASLNSTNLTTLDMEARVIKAGITDGIYTEVLDGLNEGDVIVLGQVQPKSAGAAAATNPFGSGMGRGPR